MPLLLDTVTRLDDLRVPPGNRLEALSGARTGHHSIRVDGRWRLRFVRASDGVHDVALVDDHQDATMARDIPVPHPGAILREDLMEPMMLSAHALAEAGHVPRSRVNDLCRGRQRISADIALRLGKYLGVDPRWFLGMQATYDPHVQSEKSTEEIASIPTRPAI